MAIDPGYESSRDCEECGFGGSVIVRTIGEIDEWRCPRCGVDHQDVFEADPDEHYEMLREERWK